MNIDIKEVLKIDHYIRGYIQHIASAKGKRAANEFGGYHYSFDAKLVISENNQYDLKDGIHQVLDICNWSHTSELQWNNYLIVVEDGEVYCVGEFLDTPNTDWIRDKGIQMVKKYFSNGSLPLVEPTEQPSKKVRGTFFDSEIAVTSEDKRHTANKVKKSKNGASSSSSSAPQKVSATNNTPEKRKPSGRRLDASAPLLYGFARLMTFTGMVIGDYKILRHNKSKLQVQTDKGAITFSKETGKQIDAEKPKYANKVIFNLNK